MPITLTRVAPAAPEMMKGAAGRLIEHWRATGDGASTTVVLTTDFIDYIESAVGPDSHNIDASTQKSFTVTFNAALGNNVTRDIWVSGRKN
jgi:hypothetical protein